MGRVSKKELESAITNPNQSKKLEVKKTKDKNIPQSTEIYDKVGNVQDVLPADQIMAIKEKLGNNYKFKIKCNNDGIFWNPNDKEFILDAYRSANLTHGLAYKMMVVDENSFKQYVTFLRSQDIKYYNQAQKGL